MAYRGGNPNRNRNFGGGNNYNPMGANRMGNMNLSPWDNQNLGFGGGNMRQGVGGQGMNAQAINLANNLLNNLFRNQNPPSLLDLPRGGGGGMGNRNQRSGQMINRPGQGNRPNNRRGQGGFQNRSGPGGAKPGQNKGAGGGGIRKQNAFDRAKKLLAKNATNKKKDSASGEKKTESTKESPYASVPNDMFYCHLCNKHMWDSISFENHIKGRTHLMVREGIEESYRLKANMIRQEAKITEQLKNIELDRLKRMGKPKKNQLDYCTMCDLNFHSHMSVHRKTDGHLQLKKFLHPRCADCSKEFATRIDYDTHLLSADHMKKAAERNTKVGERLRNTVTILTEEDEQKDVRPTHKKKKKPTTKKEDEDGEKKEGEGAAEGDEAEGEDAAKKEATDEVADETKEGDDLNDTLEEDEIATPPVDPEDAILDYKEGDEIPTEVENRLPKYNWTRPIGLGLVAKLECYECSLCGKLFDTENTVAVHALTVTHHRNFLKFITDKSSDTKIAQKRAAAALEESERKKRKVEEAEAAAANKVKAENGEAAAEGGEEGAGGAEGEEATELYDPSEATGDDDDVEMAENGEEGGEEVEGEGAEEEGAGDEGEEMEAQDEEEVEPEPEPKPVKAEPKPEPVKTPAKPAAAAAATTTPTSTADASPAKKATPARGAAAKSTPRGRGRGRYNRY